MPLVSNGAEQETINAHEFSHTHINAAVRAQRALLPTISARFTELYVRAALLWGGALDKHQRHLWIYFTSDASKPSDSFKILSF